MKKIRLFSAASLLCAFASLNAYSTDYTLCGQMGYSSLTQNYGIWQFTTDPQDELMQAIKEIELSPDYGGVKIDDRYYAFRRNYDSLDDKYQYMMYIYDASDNYAYITGAWTETEYISLGQVLAYNPKDKKVYAAYSESSWSGKTNRIATIDVARRSREVISSTSNQIYVMSFDEEGNLYAITNENILVKVDPATGNMSLIGDTEVDADNFSQAACISPEGDSMYWNTYSDGKGCLFSVDLATGKATLVKEMPGTSLFISMWVETVDVKEEAPAAPTNLTATFPDGALSGTVSFIAPTQTLDNSPITGELEFVIKIDGTKATEGKCQAGTFVERTVTTTTGLHRIEAYCSSTNAGQGETATLAAIYIGKDTPENPENIMLTPGQDNSLILTWEAPTKGIHNGYLNPEEVKYRVKRVNDETILSENATSPFTDDYWPELPERVCYEITAYVDDLNSLPAVSNKVMVGNPFDIPYSENFDTNAGANLYTVEAADDLGSSWIWQYEYGYYRIWSNEKKKNDWLFTPYIHLQPNVTYELAYDTWSLAKETMRICIGNAPESNAMTQVILQNSIVDTDYDVETRRVEFRVAEEGNYHIGFHSTTEDAENGLALYLDNVKLDKKPSTTNIESIDAANAEQQWFNLQGMPIKRPTAPGIYILNNKKVLITK